MNATEIEELRSHIDLGRCHQQNAVRWALERMLIHEQPGVVLADEVGCGKTYEALAALALLWRHLSSTDSPVRRVLILCKPALLRKWETELTTRSAPGAKEKRGIQSYLEGYAWRPFVETFIKEKRFINSFSTAERLWGGRQLRGVVESSRRQVPEGLYLVNQNTLHANPNRTKPAVLKYMLNTDWDVVIVDEAHHFGKGNKCDSIFATHYAHLGRGGVPDYGAEGTLRYRHIMLLTATPFELDPAEMINLLRIAKADDTDLARLAELLREYQTDLNSLYDLRLASPEHERRRSLIRALKAVRDDAAGVLGLERLMRKYMVRNRKDADTRRYSLVNASDAGWEPRQFEKFDDLKLLCRELALIPFTGPDAMFYLELRELIQETLETRRTEEDAGGTFIAADLQQGLSSYPQLVDPPRKHVCKLLRSKSAGRLRKTLTSWHGRRLHPKVAALVDVVNATVEHEWRGIQSDPSRWFGKIVVFNKLVAGTAGHLREQLSTAISPILEGALKECVGRSAFADVETLRRSARQTARVLLQRERRSYEAWCKRRGEPPLVSLQLDRQGRVRPSPKRVHPMDLVSSLVENRVQQPLFLLDFFRKCNEGPVPRCADEAALRGFVDQEINPATLELREIMDKYLDATPDQTEIERLGDSGAREEGIRRLNMLRERLRSPQVAARYDGTVQSERESSRLNFNGRWSPLVLIVSRVGEEGIDLQEQAKYVFHYDLEWNPAKMEQREGRVDREGYGHKGEKIDVRFFLLKGTYEERILHTVMQRGQWFDLLMGARRRELGRIEDDPEREVDGSDGDIDLANRAARECEEGAGGLTEDEMAQIMLDLRPDRTCPEIAGHPEDCPLSPTKP